MMLTERFVLEPENLTEQLESEGEKAEKEAVSPETARKILGVSSIDKEFANLKKRICDTQFTYNPDRADTQLRPYQAEAISKLDEFIKNKADSVAIQLPTGAGKTFLLHSFIRDRFLRRSKNVLVVTPSWEIAHQHAMTMCQYFKDGEDRVRRLGGSGHLMSLFPEYKPRDKGKAIITTSALFYARVEHLRMSLNAALVVIDEGHHGWRKKRLNSVQGFAREIGAPAIFLTATPPQNMENLPFAAQLKYLDLVPEYLVPCRVVRLETGETFDPVLSKGILSQKSRVEISSRQRRFEKIVTDSLSRLKGQTIYYAGSVAEAMGVVQEFKRNYVEAVVVHSKWSAKNDRINAIAIDKFRRGEAQVLVNVQMLAMGFDVPNVETIIVARPVESDTLFTQMVGRGARPADGKSEFILIDVHDTISKPEVAKIFEHRHLFYHGQADLEPIQELPINDESLDEPILPPSNPPLSGSKRDPLSFEAFHFLRSPKLLRYFMDQEAKEAS